MQLYVSANREKKYTDVKSTCAGCSLLRFVQYKGHFSLKLYKPQGLVYPYVSMSYYYKRKCFAAA